MADVEHSLSPAVSIMCDIFGEKIVTNARKHLKLDADPPQYEIGADTVLILPFTARSGSTFASNLLSKHPGFGHVTEWFLPRRLEILRENWKLETHNRYRNATRVREQVQSHRAARGRASRNSRSVSR